MRASSALLVAVLAATLGSAQTPKTLPPASAAVEPEIVFVDAAIYTGAGLADDRPQVVQAMAIGGGKVLAVGSNAEIRRLAGPHTRVRSLRSSRPVFVFPGFNDAHTHLGSAGRTQLNLDLTGTRSLNEMLAKLALYAKGAPAAHWITGGNWDQTLWAAKTLPTRQDLDKVTAGHPAFLDRVDGHIAIANSAALAAAGITGQTAAPAGGAIDQDAAGQPTGILRESAKDLVEKIVPPPSSEERRRGDELAMADALAHGVTSVQDFSDWEDFLVFEQMEKEGKLNLRISEWLPFRAPLDRLIAMRAHHDPRDPMLHAWMLKGFMDGSLGSRTAALKAPYADDPANTGLPQYSQDELNQMAVERARMGFQLGFHAIGDQATSMALDAFAQAEEAYKETSYHSISLAGMGGQIPCRADGAAPHPWDEKMPCNAAASPAPLPCRFGNGMPCFRPATPWLAPRNRIEHAQVVDPADIPRFAQLGVIASMQPCHLLTDMNWAEDRLGPQRAAYSYAWKAFLDAGVPLAFGTDYPVEPITPSRGLYVAVTRRNEAGTKSYFPENKLTRGQALYAYTQGSAYAEYAEASKGLLQPGFDADFILVDRDLYTAAAPALLQTQVLETYVAGRQVFAANLHIAAQR